MEPRVLPLGVLYARGGGAAAAFSADRAASLGALRALGDAELSAVLSSLCESSPASLARAMCASRALRALAGDPGLWRAAVLRERAGRWRFDGSWRQTYAGAYSNGTAGSTARGEKRPRDAAGSAGDGVGAGNGDGDGVGGAGYATERPREKQQRHEPCDALGLSGNGRESSHGAPREELDSASDGNGDGNATDEKSASAWCYYSDVLYQPRLCASEPLDDLPGIGDTWLVEHTVEELMIGEEEASESESESESESSLREMFRRRFEAPNRPCVVRGGCRHWPAIEKWDRRYLATAYGDAPATIGGYDMRVSDYHTYCDAVADKNVDDQPLYLFDKHFCERAPALEKDYSPLGWLSEDLFALLGDEARPAWRWLIAGPARSGSSWHKDPNCTSAWNALITGRKRWLLAPPHAPPPGVAASADGADVTQVRMFCWRFPSSLERITSRRLGSPAHISGFSGGLGPTLLPASHGTNAFSRNGAYTLKYVPGACCQEILFSSRLTLLPTRATESCPPPSSKARIARRVAHQFLRRG